MKRFERQKTSVAQESLQIVSQTVPLLVIRNPRARRYLLRLRPDGTARVTIPRGGSQAEARAFVECNRGWLEKQIQLHQARPLHATAWNVGSEIWFRGGQVRIESDAAGKISFGGRNNAVDAGAEVGRGFSSLSSPNEERVGVRSLNSSREPLSPLGRGEGTGRQPHDSFGTEVLSVKDSSGDLRPAIEKYLRQLAARELPPRVREFSAQHQIDVERITVRNQKSRWGSCSRRGTISLNWRLIQTPEFVRDYIILHELAHRRHMNHSARFWSEVERLCPDFRTAERWLKTHRDFLR